MTVAVFVLPVYLRYYWPDSRTLLEADRHILINTYHVVPLNIVSYLVYSVCDIG